MDNLINSEYSGDNHIMVDIETLSTKTNAVITQIAMVRFCPKTGDIFDTISYDINIQSCLDIGLTVDANTLNFWFSQSKEAQQRALNFEADTKHIKEVMESVNSFISRCGKDIRMWGKGPSFDLTKLDYINELLGFEKPWKFWLERCVRTMIADVDSARTLDFVGVPHVALDDCIHQINQIKQALHVKYGNKK